MLGLGQACQSDQRPNPYIAMDEVRENAEPDCYLTGVRAFRGLVVTESC